MSLQRPSLWRVLSETSRLISSNSLHFLALSLLFIFPAPLFSIIHTLLLQPSPSPLINSHYRRLLSNPDPVSQIPSFDKSLILSLAKSLIPFIFNLCAVSSVTTSIFDGLRSKPLKLGASLKSILTSFLPLLSTQLVYFIITLAIALAYGFCMGFLFYGLGLLGFEIEASSTLVMVVVFVTTILLLMVFVYLGVHWCLADAVAVVESKYGYAPLERSWRLVAGTRRVASLLLILLGIPSMALSRWFSAMSTTGSHGGGVVVWAALSTAVGLFGLAAETVLLVHCKEFKGELEFQSDENKLGELYVPLPRDVVDEV